MSACIHIWKRSVANFDKCERCGKVRATERNISTSETGPQQSVVQDQRKRDTLPNDDPHVVLQDIKRTLTGLLNRIDRALIT